MGRIATEHWLKADLRRVFGFFSDPRNLPKLMPQNMAVHLERLELRPLPALALQTVVESGLDPAQVAGPGSVIEISFRFVPFLPFRGRWLAEIVENEPLAYFLDIQQAGPMRRWRHRHSFCRETRNEVPGTVVRDEVEYELPFGVLGRIADAIFVEPMMKRTFQSRQQELQRLLAAE